MESHLNFLVNVISECKITVVEILAKHNKQTEYNLFTSFFKSWIKFFKQLNLTCTNAVNSLDTHTQKKKKKKRKEKEIQLTDLCNT